MRAVDAPFDLVVSTNGGHPLDRNLYQAVKGMAAADRIVRERGVVVMAAACEDGIPADGAFARLLSEAQTPGDLIGATGGPELDRWQAQVLGRVVDRAEVHLYSEGLSEDAIRDAQLQPVGDLGRTMPCRRGPARAFGARGGAAGRAPDGGDGARVTRWRQRPGPTCAFCPSLTPVSG